MKAITVIFIARDEAEAEEINREIEKSHLLNEWPVYAWTTGDASRRQVAWFADEYADEEIEKEARS